MGRTCKCKLNANRKDVARREWKEVSLTPVSFEEKVLYSVDIMPYAYHITDDYLELWAYFTVM